MRNKALDLSLTGTAHHCDRGLRIISHGAGWDQDDDRRDETGRCQAGVHPGTQRLFAEAVQRGDAAWQAQDFSRAIYFYVQAMDELTRRRDLPSQKWALSKMPAEILHSRGGPLRCPTAPTPRSHAFQNALPGCI